MKRTTLSHPPLPLSSPVIDIIIIVAKTRLAVVTQGEEGGKEKKIKKEKVHLFFPRSIVLEDKRRET